ncbi:MAG: fluoride efflux transporter CrcB [Pseudomonadota bacterium]|jgi:CrcB protein|nr:fluoride efflux transporter CrcB [Pseudomonadota bacterium]MEC8797151.1 fluoride efflux transporter CrcB [Pseudomonadota bacterium]|tara:strand:- start:820 stop:1185 length:366 start_codon:yes stop_codon:yes gene_type:complete
MSLFFIGFGGFFGAISRYLVGVFINNIGLNTNISTLLVNIIGSFFMGLLFYIFSTNSSDFYKMFFVVGFLGSFTTFSAFSLDAMNLFLASQYINFLIYIILSVVLSILFIFLGFVSAKFIY